MRLITVGAIHEDSGTTAPDLFPALLSFDPTGTRGSSRSLEGRPDPTVFSPEHQNGRVQRGLRVLRANCALFDSRTVGKIDDHRRDHGCGAAGARARSDAILYGRCLEGGP